MAIEQPFRQLRPQRLLRTFLAFSAFIAFVTYFLACVAYVACVALDGKLDWKPRFNSVADLIFFVH